MFAYIKMPGHSEFQYFGPATKKECIAWAERYNEPYTLLSNKAAYNMRWAGSGEPIISKESE